MTVVGHLAGGLLVVRQLANRMSLSKSDQTALRVLGTFAAALPDLDFLVYLARARSSELGSDFQHHKWITHTFPITAILALTFDLFEWLRPVMNRRFKKR